MFGDLHRTLILLCGLLWAPTAFSQGVIGVVRDVAGPGISDAVVTAKVYGPNGFMEFVDTSDALGRFIFPDYTGSWTVTVESPSLNAAGYLSVGSASFSITDQERNPRFTTRKLDLSRRVHGILTNAWGVPIEGAFVRASIEENHQTYQTNLITDSDGRFWFAASPAVWRLVTFDSSFPPSRV